MLVDKTQKAPADATNVSLDEIDVEFWCARFSVTPDELHAAVGEVGPRAEDVEKRLHAAARQSFSKGGED